MCGINRNSFILFAYICIISILSLSGCEGFEQGRQSSLEYATMDFMKDWAIALEKYHKINKEYPTTNSIEELQKILVPTYSERLRTKNPWKEKYWVKCSKDGYEIIGSKGKGNIKGSELEESEKRNKHLIMIQNGKFIQYSEQRSKLADKFNSEIQKYKKN